MKREQCITIRPGPISHKVILWVGARVITQLVPADNPVEAVQLYPPTAAARCARYFSMPLTIGWPSSQQGYGYTNNIPTVR